MAAYLQVVLRESLKNLGTSGDVVRVRPGYARNFLVPRGLASYATEKNIARLEHEKREAVARAAKVRAESDAIAKLVEGLVLKISRSVGSDDRMYGSVTSKEIAEALAEKGHKIDRRKIELAQPIRTLGTHDVHVRLAPEVGANFKVEVVKQASN